MIAIENTWKVEVSSALAVDTKNSFVWEEPQPCPQDLLAFTEANELLERDAFKDSWYELMLWKPL